MPSIYEHETGEEGVPCLFLQASFVKGGVILATAWHHQVADAYSLDTFYALLAENTRAVLGGHAPRLSTAYELDIDRTPFIGVSKGENEGAAIDDDGFPHQLASLVRQGPSRLADMIASGRRLGKIVNMLVHIPEERAAALKKTCLSAAPREESDFVTTYQCVSTSLHRTLVRARLRTGCMQPSEATAIVHAVNLRGRAPEVRPTYFGNAVALSLMTPMTASELVGDEGLQHGTVNSRHDIRNVGLHHHRRHDDKLATDAFGRVTKSRPRRRRPGDLLSNPPGAGRCGVGYFA